MTENTNYLDADTVNDSITRSGVCAWSNRLHASTPLELDVAELNRVVADFRPKCRPT